MSIRKNPLSCAVLAALFPIAAAQAQESPASLVTADGTNLTVQDEILQAVGDNTYGLYALNSGHIIASSLDVTTRGENASALVARSGGQIDISDGSISTQGQSSYGLDLKDSGSSIRARNVCLSTTGWSASAVHVTFQTSVRLEDASIKTQSATAAAVHLEESDFLATGTSVVNSQHGGGIIAWGGSVSFSAGSIQSLGVGIRLDSSLNDTNPAASARISDATILAGWAGLALYGAGTTADLESMTITVDGDDSSSMKSGILIAEPSGSASVNVRDSVIKAYGTVSYGVTSLGGRISLEDSTIATNGENGFGVMVNGIDSLATVDANDVAIHTASRGSVGAMVLEGSFAFNGGNITTLGDVAFGVMADGISSKGAVSLTGTRISTYGNDAHAIVAGSATLDVKGTQLITSGSSSHGIWMYGRTSTDQGSLLLTHGNWVDSQDSAALRLSGGEHQLSISDSTVVGRSNFGSGTLLLVEDVAGVLPLEQLLDPSAVAGPPVATHRVLFDVSGSKLYGDVVVDSATANVQMTLRNGTVFNGALRNDSGYQVAQLAMDGSSQWNVRGTSSVGSLDHAGTIAFVAPTTDDFKTLTVTGDYVGNDGHWLFNRALGDDASRGDQLVIQGNSSGTASVSVRNAGGAGALTSEGIRLISVAGQSDAQFSLQGRAVAGAYDYFLYKGGVSTPDDGSWYLRSEYDPPVDPPEPPDPPKPPIDPPAPPIDPPVAPPVDPPLPPLPPLPPVPPRVERPEPAVYMANQSSALGMFRHSLYDRSGDPADATDGGSDAIAWAQVRSSQPGSRGSQVDVDSELNSVLLGVGRRFEANAGGQLQAGVMAGQGRARNDSRSQVTGFTARGVVNGASLGLYATWLQDARMDSGAYVDSWLQYGRFRNSVQGEGLQKEHYRSSSWTGSAEAGYVLPVQRTAQRGVYLEPQLQVIHSRYDADRVVEANGTVVEGYDKDSTTTRVGLRLYTRSLTQRQGQVQPFVAVNWWSGGNDVAIAVDSERLRRQLPRDIYEAKAGVQVNLSGGWRGWGEISRQTGGMGFRDTSGQLGLSYSW